MQDLLTMLLRTLAYRCVAVLGNAEDLTCNRTLVYARGSRMGMCSS